MAANFYYTNFPLKENPISENGKWTNPSSTTNNLNMATNGSYAYGSYGMFSQSDALAVLTGNWGRVQSAQGTIRIATTPSSRKTHEVELHLLMTACFDTADMAEAACGYEFNCSVSSGFQYQEIARWDRTSFAYLGGGRGNNFLGRPCADGDVMMATVDASGNLREYINGTLVNSATDTTYTTGNPGMGTWNTDSGNNYGLSKFTASDGGNGLQAGSQISPRPPAAAHSRPGTCFWPKDTKQPSNLQVDTIRVSTWKNAP